MALDSPDLSFCFRQRPIMQSFASSLPSASYSATFFTRNSSWRSTLQRFLASLPRAEQTFSGCNILIVSVLLTFSFLFLFFFFFFFLQLILKTLLAHHLFFQTFLLAA